MPRFFPAIAIAIISMMYVALSVSNAAYAQFVPRTSSAQESSEIGWDAVVEQARREGSTVIVIRPKDTQVRVSDMQPNSMSSSRILEARTRVVTILSSASELWPNALETLAQASPEGDYRWFWEALAIAALGFSIGWLAIIRVQKAGRNLFSAMWDPNPQTTADKAKYLFFRLVLAIVYAALFFLIPLAVVVVFDPAQEASRRLIYEIALAYVIYRLMLRGISWNLFAYDAPSHRLVNLDDDAAVKIDRDFGFTVAAVLVFTTVARYLTFIAQPEIAGGLTPDNIRLLLLSCGAVIILAFIVFTLRHWKSWQRMFAPKASSAWMYRVRTAFAAFVPSAFVLYSVLAFVAFVYRLALDQPSPGVVIAAPFLLLMASTMAFGVVLLVIQWFYNARQRRFEALRSASGPGATVRTDGGSGEGIDNGSGDELNQESDPDEAEFQPVFRSFFESAALAVISTVAVAQLGQLWGMTDGGAGPWDAAMNIVLAGVLGCLCYQAVTTLIDRRIAQESGVADDQEQELGGEGGGRGVSRVATLLPILRYLMIIVVFSAATMVILSSLGFDIGPIFAGAGVVGIAVGFGAQTLIRDIFSGAFFLMDDAFRMGEYVETGSIKGTVEKISIRSFQLRHHLGKLHTIPFGEITQLTNYSRDWVMTKLPLRVTYDTDVEKVRKLIKKLGQRLLEDPEVGHTFMEPLKSQGVYKMEDSAMIIRVKFMTKPGEQFVVRKLVYASIRELFSEAGITFAHKEVTVRIAENGNRSERTEQEKQGATAAARSVLDAEAEQLGAATKAGDGR